MPTAWSSSSTRESVQEPEETRGIGWLAALKRKSLEQEEHQKQMELQKQIEEKKKEEQRQKLESEIMRKRTSGKSPQPRERKEENEASSMDLHSKITTVDDLDDDQMQSS